jgi:hypothetical protein
MLEEMIEVYMWSDGTWCLSEDLEQMLTWMSDDFEVKMLTPEEYEKLM